MLPQHSCLSNDPTAIYPVAGMGSVVPTAPRPLRSFLRKHEIPFHQVAAIRTGEFRPPRAYEWYLSGAIVEAYMAPNNLTTPYHIARLVQVVETTNWQIIAVLDELEDS